MLAFILGLLLLGAAIVTDISADFLGYNMPIFVKYICFGASIVSLIYSYVSSAKYEIRISESDWNTAGSGHSFVIPDSKHRKGKHAACVVYQETENGREVINVAIENLTNGDIEIGVNQKLELIAVVS